VEVEYEGRSEYENAKLSVQLRFVDDAGGALFALWNKLVNADENRYPASGVFRFHVASLPLRAGKYSISIYINSSKGVEDVVDGAMVLTVFDGDFFRTGRVSTRDCGHFLVPHECTHSSR
jgi:hypothetical protein